MPASHPTQPTATRPLAIQKNGTWYTYGWDLTKNICETYRTDGRIDLAYTYTPYGEVSPAHTYDQPLRWSSEYHDTELGLVYYNYRHYNPAMGRWMGRDFIVAPDNEELYEYCINNPTIYSDVLGMKVRDHKRNDSYNARARQRVGKALNHESKNQDAIAQLAGGSNKTIVNSNTALPAMTSLFSSIVDQYIFYKDVQSMSTIFHIIKHIEELCQEAKLRAERSANDVRSDNTGCCVARFEILSIVNRPAAILMNHSISYYFTPCCSTNFMDAKIPNLSVEYVKIPITCGKILMD